MTLVYRPGDLIRLTVPTMSGWQGVGIVLEAVHQDDDPDTTVAFRKQGEDDDATPSIALLSEVKPVLRFETQEIPAVRAALHAYQDGALSSGKWSHRAGLAAAFRAVADQIDHDWSAFNCIDTLYEIAAELEKAA